MHKEIRIPFVTLPNWIRAAGHCGFQIEPLFAANGIQPDLIHLHQASISLNQQDQLMRACVAACAKHAPHLHFPFVLGQSFSFEYMPELATYINTSGSLREASQALVWVKSLVNPYIDLQLEEGPQQARLSLLHESEVPSSEQVFYTESVLVSVWHFARELLGHELKLGLLRLRHPPPVYARKYEECLHLPIAFNQSQDALEFDRALLDRPLKGAAPSLHEQAKVLVDKRLAQRPHRQGYSALVQIALDNHPDLLGKDMEACAAKLKLHPRSLQRRLALEHTGFAELRDEWRFQNAVNRFRHGPVSLDQLSEDLGFADRRSFTRAFKRWSGSTPSRYRKSLKQT